MKAKLFTIFSFIIFITFLSFKQPTVPGNQNYQKYTAEKAEQMLQDLRKGRLPIHKFAKLVGLQLNQSIAQEQVGDASCEAIMEEARDKCSAAWADYDHGALKYFNGTLCRFNNETPAGIENVLCHFRRSMGINVDVDNLPLSATKSFGGMEIEVSIIEPTESWASTEGYEAKGTVTVNGDDYMILYWGGSGASTKGFMIEGFVSSGMGGQRASYTQWDLSDASNQFVKIYMSEFPSGSYLSQANVSSSYRGDFVVYGAVNYNSTTNNVSTQIVMIESKRGAQSNSGDFGCFKMFANGEKGATVNVAKTSDALSDDGHLRTSTDLTFADMDGVSLVDDVNTANGTGTTYSNQAALETAFGYGAGANVFDKSCDDLNNAGGAGATEPFSSSRTSIADFTLQPSDVF